MEDGRPLRSSVAAAERLFLSNMALNDLPSDFLDLNMSELNLLLL